MPKPNQLTFVTTTDQRLRLERLSAESGRSVAALIREAVARLLDPFAEAGIPATALWTILRDPVNWAEFKKLAAEMEAATAPPAAPVEPAAPRPTWRHQRAEGVAPRPRSAAVDDEEPPF
jgi:hypothetical protein